MSDIYGAGDDQGGGPPPGMDGGQGGPGGPGGGPGGPPGMGGGPGQNPILAALARRSQGAQVSAPGPGNMADGMEAVRTVIGLLQGALNNFQTGSKQHMDILTALRTLSRHTSQGDSSAGVEQTQMGDIIRNIRRASMLQKIMQSQQQGQPGGGGQPAAPMPSAPMPGS